MSQSDLNTDFYISAYVRIEICILIRLHYVHYCRDTTSDFIFHKLHRIFKLSGFTKFVQVRYLQDIVNMLLQVLK